MAKIAPVATADIAVAIDRRAGQGDGEAIGQRQVQRCLEVPPPIVTDRERYAPRNMIEVRLSGSDADRAADRVAAEKRSLRTAQNFDAIDVHQVEQPADRPRDIDAVEIKADARFGEGRKILLPDAADIDRSEEHTSELQSLMRISYDVFCLKKKNTIQINTN